MTTEATLWVTIRGSELDDGRTLTTRRRFVVAPVVDDQLTIPGLPGAKVTSRWHDEDGTLHLVIGKFAENPDWSGGQEQKLPDTWPDALVAAGWVDG